MKQLTYLALIVVALQACRRDNTDNALAKDNKDVANAIFRSFNARNWDSVAFYYTDTCIFLDPAFGNNYIHKSRADIIAQHTAMLATTPDIQREIKGLYTDRNTVAIEYIETAGNLNPKARPCCMILTLKNRRVLKSAIYYDK